MIASGNLLAGSPFVAYTYAYPHKTAYRPFPQPIPLERVWNYEPRASLFLYFHVPFCEYRCGFCNLFTHAQPESGLTRRYLSQLRREAEQVRAALADARFARMAIGGGTPTFLDVSELQELFAISQTVFGARPRSIPTSIEASPATLDREKLELFQDLGIDRLSVGVQTFSDQESRALGRPQRRSEAEAALELVRRFRFPILNIDLIYGAESQTLPRWLDCLRAAIAYQPEELYLYPLYVRPLTGLGRRDRDWDDQRSDSYRAGRDFLLERGYQQVSFRMFRAGHAPLDTGPVYCCQADGMVGLGCGARSYTAGLHYSGEYAVGREGISHILGDYLTRDIERLGMAEYGFQLDADEQQRRFVLLSLLQTSGLDGAAYAHRFGTNFDQDWPQLRELETLGLATFRREFVRLTDAGLQWSDAIGPWLYSARVRQLMKDYACR